jgi:hypothetical protein
MLGCPEVFVLSGGSLRFYLLISILLNNKLLRRILSLCGELIYIAHFTISNTAFRDWFAGLQTYPVLGSLLGSSHRTFC